MAVTSIWAIKNNLKQVLDYTSNPEKTTRDDLEDVLTYAANDLKTEQKQYVTGVNCDPDTAYTQMIRTKKKYGKEDGVMCFHGYQSFAQGEVDPETAHRLGVETIQRMFGDDFEVLVCTHTNTENIHNHFVVNSVSWTTGLRFLNKHKDLRKYQKLSDQICRENGLSVVEPQWKSESYGEHNANEKNDFTKRKLIIEDVEYAIHCSDNWKEFLKHMEDMGYTIKYGKHIGVIPKGSSKNFRLYKLSKTKDYSEESIRAMIAESNYIKFEPFQLPDIPTHIYVNGKNHPTKKLKGFKALYFKTMYQMGILPKNAPRVKRVHFLFKEELLYLDQITKQTDLMFKENLETIEDIQFLEITLNEKIDNLSKSNRNVCNKLQRCKIPEQKELLEKEHQMIVEQIKECREQLKLCNGIKERSGIFEKKIEMFEQEMEVKEHERRRRDSRSDGKNDSARY